MPCSAQTTKTLAASPYCRRYLLAAALILCALVLVQTLVVRSFHITSGSMAPTLYGHHRKCDCPVCGHEVVVGRHQADPQGAGDPRFYRKAFCPNCGFHPLPLADSPELPGDQVVVNQAAYLFCSPSRWEIVVFRLLGVFYIKRLLGLPGEDILIHDGDLYVNGELQRKTFAQAKAMRVLMFDAEKGEGCERWSGSLAGRLSPAAMTYRNFFPGSSKCEPIRDEYAYNAGLHADSECVHDFMIDAEIEAAGKGPLALRLCDGHDWVEVSLPIGESRTVEAFSWPMNAPEQTRKLAETEMPMVLRAKRRYHVELAFVDRRLSLAVDGVVCLSADLPEAKSRQGVERPFQMEADGVDAALRSFRLYRDVHYGQQGRNGVRGKSVRLGVDQFFFLGDNSPYSEDSRFWPDAGRVTCANLVGPVMFVPSRR